MDQVDVNRGAVWCRQLLDEMGQQFHKWYQAAGERGTITQEDSVLHQAQIREWRDALEHLRYPQELAQIVPLWQRHLREIEPVLCAAGEQLELEWLCQDLRELQINLGLAGPPLVSGESFYHLLHLQGGLAEPRFIEELGLRVRTTNTLRRMHVRTINFLVTWIPDELDRQRGIGGDSIAEIMNRLHAWWPTAATAVLPPAPLAAVAAADAPASLLPATPSEAEVAALRHLLPTWEVETLREILRTLQHVPPAQQARFARIIGRLGDTSPLPPAGEDRNRRSWHRNTERVKLGITR